MAHDAAWADSVSDIPTGSLSQEDGMEPFLPRRYSPTNKLCDVKPKITSVGFIPITFIGPWVAAYRFMVAPVKLVQEGLAKSPNGIFRIATLQGEYVLVTDRRKVGEYLKAPDSVLNAQDGSNDVCPTKPIHAAMNVKLGLQQQQIPYTMGYGVGHRTYHTQVVRGPITKEIVTKTPIMVDEASRAFDDMIGSPQGTLADYLTALVY